MDDFFWAYHDLINAVGINGLLALSIYIVMAAGQLSLGQAAFMGLGAYSSALLSVKFAVPFPAVLLAGMAVPALAALIIGRPTAKLTGVYLAIVTLALGEILRIVLTNAEFSGGALGLGDIPRETETGLIYTLLALITAGLWAVSKSRIGRAMEAMREDEIAASVIGIDVPAYKLGLLVASAMLAGLAGALSAHSSSFIGPKEYGFEPAVTILSFALLGGIGTPFGPVLGAAILTLLPEVLRPLHDARLVFNGLIIVAAVLLLPRGLLPLRLRRSS